MEEVINRCKIDGCNQLTYGGKQYCYYHQKQQDGLINPKDVYYLKSKDELACVRGLRKINWDLAIKELPRIKRICNIVLKWSKFPISELIQESLIRLATLHIKSFQYKHYLNVSLHGMLKNYVAQFRSVVSYYWKPFFRSINDYYMDESISLLNDNCINPEECVIAKELFELDQEKIKQFALKLDKYERKVFKFRLLSSNPMPLRQLEKRIKISRSTINRCEQDLKEQFKRFIKDG